MTIVRITIRKQRADAKYAYSKKGRDLFATEYLVRTDASFPSPQLKEYARALAQAESRLYPPSILFKGARVNLATPGASAQELKGQFSVIGLEGLRGRFVMAKDDVLAFPPVIAVYKRHVMPGRSGELLIQHALTAAEFSLYTQKQVDPSRFDKPNSISEALSLSFSEELIEAVRPSNGTHILQTALDAKEGIVREIRDFMFVGYRTTNARPKRKKVGRPTKADVQRRIDDLALSAEMVKEAAENATPKPDVAALLAPLRAEARKAYTSLTSLNQQRLKWPEVFQLPSVIERED